MMPQPQNIELMEFKGSKWYYRPKSSGGVDEYIVRETDYNFLQVFPDDVWLDCGANIGTFAFKVSPKVKRVISYEPELSNIAVFNMNATIHRSDNVLLKPFAIGPSDGNIEFYVSDKHPYAHTTIKTRGRRVITVPMVSLDKEIAMYAANKLKLDIEGAEYGTLMGSKLDGIKRIVMEWHTSKLDKVPHADPKSQYQDVKGYLEGMGFSLTTGKLVKKWGNEATVIVDANR